MTKKTLSSTLLPVSVIVLCLLPLCFGVHGHEVWTPDEPREAEIARGMAEKGPWFIPHLGGKPFVEKPPLYYWAAALSVRAAGRLVGTTTAVRMVSTLCAAATLLVLAFAAQPFLGTRRTAIACVILATSAGFNLAAHWINIDPLLMLLTAAAVLLFFRGRERKETGILLLAYLAGGLAFLVKGFIGWVFIFPPCLYIFWAKRREGGCRPAVQAIGLLLLLVPAAAWMAAFYRVGGKELWREWLIVNHFGRFLGTTHYLGHIKGPFYYLSVIAALSAPWIILLPDWLARRGWREIRGEKDGGRRLLVSALIWAVSGTIILSLSGTKRDVYLYPLLPAFALCLSAMTERVSRWLEIAALVISLLFFIPLPVFSFLRLNWNGERVETVFAFNVAILLCALAGGWCLYRWRGHYLSRLAALSALFSLTVVFAVFPVLDQVWSYENVTRTLAAAIPPEKRDRVAGWQAGEVELGIFPYYAGIELRDVRDRSRLIEILSGRDPEFEYLVVSRMEEEFPAQDPGIPPWEVVARAKKGPRRVFYLIRGRQP
jgi:4-amino-4-deoxy-L-arabinose transferase-like glycosyltransferase